MYNTEYFHSFAEMQIGQPVTSPIDGLEVLHQTHYVGLCATLAMTFLSYDYYMRCVYYSALFCI